ncbi:MAG: TolC family protein [Phycisphaeraceae bacterium]|nr:TolC family protein [Phycisphaerales bacterium]MCB9859548.1 TolC family protein [Phycisphaeraceae bacterium]
MHQRTFVSLATSASSLVLLAGCSYFQSSPFDYAEPIDAERFRSIETLSLTPAQDQMLDAQTLELRSRFEGRESVDMALEEARAIALSRNLDLQVAMVNPAIANESLSAEEAAFEAVLSANGTYSKTDSPTSSSLNDAQAEFTQFNPSVSVPLRTGGRATVSLPMTRNETNNSFSTLNPAYTADLGLTFSQPLLRNAGRWIATYGIRIASYNHQISQAQTKLRIIAQLAAVDRAYWRLYQIRQELDVRQQQYELAVAQLERAERRVRAETAAEIEVTRAQSGVASSLEAILVSENAVLSQQRELKRLLNAPGLDVDTSSMVVPTSAPDPVRYDADRTELMQMALANRMELLEEELRLAQNAADIRFLENQAEPSVSVNAGYNINGLGESLGDAAEILAENHFEDWNIGFSASVPLGNEAAQANLRSAILSRIQRIATQEDRRRTIIQEVAGALDSLESDWQRIMAARQSVILNQRAFDGEQRQFTSGRSTSTDVLDASSRLAEAKLTEIRAVVDYQITQINLAVATGTLMGSARVRWDSVESPQLDGWWLFPKAPEGTIDGTPNPQPD